MESNPGSRSRKQRQNATRSQLMGREVIPSTAAIQFPLAAIHPRSCNTPARFDSKRSADLCVRTRSDPWGRCSFPCCRNVGERFVCPYPIHTDPSIDDSTLSLFDDVFRDAYTNAQSITNSVEKHCLRACPSERRDVRWRRGRRMEGGGRERGSRRSIETSFHRATPYIAWENKSCGHSPGGRLDTGRCHRTRVAATATDRVREREDGYQWLHYTIPGGREREREGRGSRRVRE